MSADTIMQACLHRTNGRCSSVAEVLAEHRLRWPEIAEQEALADLFAFGIQTNETFVAYNTRLAENEDHRHNVFKHPDRFAGYHVGWVKRWKPSVFRFFATRVWSAEIEQINGFVTDDVLRVAIETHVIAKPNGYSMP